MKRFSALIILILLCSQTAFAFQHYVGQFYDGEARPRTEVAWIWMGTSKAVGKVYLRGIDHSKISTYSSDYTHFMFLNAVEVLPGKHILTVQYQGLQGISEKDAEVEIDVQAGENYLVDADISTHWNRASSWNTIIKTFSPSAKDIEKLKREKLEHPVSVDGVVQSWEPKHQQLLLTVPGSAQPRIFKCNFSLQAGQKIRVFYFPSMPENGIDVNRIE